MSISHSINRYQQLKLRELPLWVPGEAVARRLLQPPEGAGRSCARSAIAAAFGGEPWGTLGRAVVGIFLAHEAYITICRSNHWGPK